MPSCCPTYGYESIDPTQPTYSVKVSEVISGDIDLSFNLTRDWSKDSLFWSIGVNFTKVVEKGNPNYVGDIRYFPVGGSELGEKMLNVNLEDRTFAYGLDSMVPPVYKGLVTYASFEPIDSMTFRATWSTCFQPLDESPAVVAAIKAGQTEAYQQTLDVVKFVNTPVHPSPPTVLVDPTKPTYSVTVSDVVTGDIDLTFNLTRDWSMNSPFWSSALNITKVIEKGNPYGVGDIRFFETATNGRQLGEILLYVNPDDRTFNYGLDTMVPPLYRFLVTYVSFEPIDSDNFRATWSTQFQPIIDSPVLVASLKATQTLSYQLTIAGIKFMNNPVLGIATIAVSGGTSAGQPNYLYVRVPNGPANTINVDGQGILNEPDKEPSKHNVMSYDDQVVFTLTDYVYPGEDKLIGRGFIPVRQLKKDETPMEILLKNESGNVVGKYNIEASVEWNYPEPTDAATSFGRAAFTIFESIKKEVLRIAESGVMHQIQPEDVRYATYDENVYGPLPKYCDVLPVKSVIMPPRTGELFQRMTEYLYSQGPLLGLIAILSEMPDPELMQIIPGPMAVDKLKELLSDPFMAPYTGLWMPEPEQMIENLKDPLKSDLEMCAQLIRGVNPMKITVATSIQQIPEDMHDLKDESGRDVPTLIATKSLFFCDYKNVGIGEYDSKLGVYYNQATNINGTGPMGPMKYWYAPFLAVFKNTDGKLDVLGFILTRFTDKPNKVYNRQKTPPNQYSLAKFHLTCADNQDHQFVQHLGLAHLCMEPFAVANQNCFPDGHPVGQLLHPHFKDTIGINFLARQTLVSSVAPFTDATFSPGTTNAMKIFSDAYEKWDFFRSNFKNALAARGFEENGSDGIEGFYYRDDGFKLWNLFVEHFQRMVLNFYDADEDVASDAVLQGWCDEIRDPKKGNIASFPATIDSIELLTEVITTIVFQCSAQHAAVNFSQLRYVSYVPNRPNLMRTPMLELDPEKGDIGEDELYASLPSLASGQFQTLFSYLLTTPPDNPFELYNTFEDEYPKDVKKFKDELDTLSQAIRDRNQNLMSAGDVPYEYLDPNQLSQSINI